MFDLMEDIDFDLVRAQTKKEFIESLAACPYEILHVTTHGSSKRVGKERKFLGWWSPGGKIEPRDLAPLKNKLKGLTIVSTACRWVNSTSPSNL